MESKAGIRDGHEGSEMKGVSERGGRERDDGREAEQNE